MQLALIATNKSTEKEKESIVQTLLTRYLKQCRSLLLYPKNCVLPSRKINQHILKQALERLESKVWPMCSGDQRATR